MSKSFIGGAVVRIGGAGGRRNVRRYMLDRSAAANCSVFRSALKVVMVAELFATGDIKFRQL